MAPKFKKPKKTKEVGGSLHGRFSAKKKIYGQLRGVATYSHHEALDKHNMGGKEFERQRLPFCGVLLSFKREPYGNSSTWLLRNLSLYAFCWLYVWICLSTEVWEDCVAGASAVTPFSAENNVPGVSSVV